MGKSKRILALIGVALLVILYIITLIAALFSSPSFSGLFTACLYCTIVVPLLLYAYILLYKVLKGRRTDEMIEDSENKKH